MELCSESRKIVAVLEDELEKLKQSENKVLDSGVSQTKELEAAKKELEESKLQIASLREQLQNLQSSSAASSREQNATPKSVGPQSEIDVLKKQLKAAIEGEEHSTKAMIDLSLALKEVATECNQTKEKLISAESELEHVKEEAEHLKNVVRDAVDKYQKLLDEEKKETELHKNTADRLRMEAEETFLAWNGKEMGFVEVIKEVEEEKARTKQENVKLTESLTAAENTSRTAREENDELKDALKQALNEANVAKEAASIAQEENSKLKDSLADKEGTLDSLTQENDKLRISEAAANEKIEELNRLLSQAHSEQKTDDKYSGTAFMSPESVFDDHKEYYSKHHKEDHGKQEAAAVKKGFSFDLHKIKLHNKVEDEDDTLVDEDPVNEALKGSIFDPTSKTPRSEAHTPKQAPKHHHHHHHHHHLHHHRKKSSQLNLETLNSDDLNHLDVGSHHDSEGTYSDESAHKRRHHKEDHGKQKAASIKKGFSFDLHKIKFHHKTEDEDDSPVDQDPVKDEALKGSIFDPSTKTPRSEAHTPKHEPKHHRHHHQQDDHHDHHHHHHHRKKSSLSNIETLDADDLNYPDSDSHHDSDGMHSDESAHKRKNSLALKGFGYLLMRKSFTQHANHAKKESTISSPDHE